MWLKQLITRHLRRTSLRRRSPVSQSRVRPVVLHLEDRTVPSTFTAASVADLIADINAANAAGGANAITLVAGTTFTLTARDNLTDGPTGLPVIMANDSLTIQGSGDIVERSTAIGTPAFRLLDVAAGASLMVNMATLQGGLATNYQVVAGGNIETASGGAIFNRGTLSLNGVTVRNNTARGYSPTGTYSVPGGDAAGGGLWSSGVLIMVGCTVTNNTAAGGKGGDGGILSVGAPGDGGGPQPGGAGGNGFGGGLYVAGGTVTLTTTSVSGNSATGGAGGKGAKHASNGAKGQGVGGGIHIDDSLAVVDLDAFTVNGVKRNHASTSDANIRGSYHVVG
jgi:hypothetical protein